MHEGRQRALWLKADNVHLLLHGLLPVLVAINNYSSTALDHQLVLQNLLEDATRHVDPR